MQINSSTASVTNGSAVISSASIDWSNLVIGDIFSVYDSNVFYSVGSLPTYSTGRWFVTLSTNYAGATNAACRYVVQRSFTPRLGIPYPEQGDTQSAAIFKRAMLQLDEEVSNIKSGTSAISNQAALRTIDTSALLDGTTIRLLGHNTPYDGGEGTYVYSSTAIGDENYGTRVVPSSGTGRWLRKLNDIISVKVFGCVGDGVTDDSAAFIRVYAAAYPGQTIIYPNGTYVQTNNIALPCDYLHLIGEGHARIISNATGQDRKYSAIGRKYIKFTNLEFDGLGLTNLGDSNSWPGWNPNISPGTVHFDTTSDVDISLCRFFGHNFPVTVLGDCTRYTVSRNTFGTYYQAFHCYFKFNGNGTSQVDQEGSNNPCPSQINLSNNFFGEGIFKGGLAVTEGESVRPRMEYGPFAAFNSGGALFRGSQRPTYVEDRGIVVHGNTFYNACGIGIEMQAMGAGCVITSNSIYGSGMGISTSYAQRTTVANNTIRNFDYCGIEVDGRQDGNVSEDVMTNSNIAITGNIIDSRDRFERDCHWVVGGGITITGCSRDISVSGGSISHCKTAISVRNKCHDINISGVTIETNDQSGNGGIGPWSPNPADMAGYVQGIHLYSEIKNVSITGCTFRPYKDSWCRMINVEECEGLTINDCRITSNGACLYLKNTSQAIINGNLLRIGTARLASSGCFIVMDSANLPCVDIAFTNNKFSGVSHLGIHSNIPANTVDRVSFVGNDTSNATTEDGLPFITRDVYGTGVRGRFLFSGNVGGGDNIYVNNVLVPTSAQQTNLQIPMYSYEGAATLEDDERYTSILMKWNSTLNLQTTVGYRGVRKRVICATPFTVTIHPKAGETINGATGDVVLTSRGEFLSIESDGVSGWWTV